MTQSSLVTRGRVAQRIAEIGSCLELVPMDPHFGGVSVGLYVKDDVCTVWSFSRAEGVGERLRAIRDQMVKLGGVEPVDGQGNQLVFPCGMIHERPVKFLLTQAVTKSPDFVHPDGPMTIKDSKSALMLTVKGVQEEDRCVYHVSGEGEMRNPALRLRMVVAGFVRYGEMEKVGDTEVVVPLRSEPRRARPAAPALLPQHQRGGVDAGSRVHARPDDDQHAGLYTALGKQEGIAAMAVTFTIETERKNLMGAGLLR